MAGLLDAFDDAGAQLGLGLLAAAAPRADGAGFGQRLMEGVNNSIAMKRAAAQERMLQLQMQAAQRKSDMMNDWLKQLQGGDEQGLTTGGQAAGMGSPGVSIGGVTAGGGSATPIGASAGSLGGVPRSAAFADLALNDGKHIGEWMYDRSKPNWVQFGNKFINTNAPGFNGGAIDKLTVTPDGKGVIEGSDGSVRIAPGSLDAYSAFQNASERSKADYSLIDVPDGNGGKVKMTTTDAIKRLSQPSSPVVQSPSLRGNGYAGGSPQAAAQGQLQVLDQEARDLGLSDADRAAVNRDIARLQQGTRPSGQFGQELSKEEETRRVDTAKADVVRDTNRITDAKKFKQMQEGIGRAITLLGQDPTHSGAGALVDDAYNFFGKSTKGAETAAQLSSLSGWLTANVPRMEGPQSDRDVENYKIQAGMVGDKTKPIEQRVAAAKEVIRLQQKYAELNGYGNPEPQNPIPKPQDKAPPVPVKGMIRNGYKFLGGDPSKKESWVPVKGAEGGW